MFESRELSRLIREKKKRSFRPDMDDAGQEGLPPEQALAVELNAKVNDMTGEDHEPASDDEMGENDSSQDKMSLKRAMGIVAKYFATMKIEK